MHCSGQKQTGGEHCECYVSGPVTNGDNNVFSNTLVVFPMKSMVHVGLFNAGNVEINSIDSCPVDYQSNSMPYYSNCGPSLA